MKTHYLLIVIIAISVQLSYADKMYSCRSFTYYQQDGPVKKEELPSGAYRSPKGTFLRVALNPDENWSPLVLKDESTVLKLAGLNNEIIEGEEYQKFLSGELVMISNKRKIQFFRDDDGKRGELLIYDSDGRLTMIVKMWEEN
ncbi:hypothetical protein P3T73_06920 [Kiritimatiellota bacterium B12222]|nr:hypothetical protein P3T73_06920 [Kiritimatiellota bacterium B12222]